MGWWVTEDTTKFSIAMKVRDYECDLQGIVNNAVYLNYLEHARHEYLESIGLNFKKLVDRGIYFVAVQAEQIYKKALMPGQNFIVTCQMLPESKFKARFIHEIINEKLESVLTASMVIASIDKDRKPMLMGSIINFNEL